MLPPTNEKAAPVTVSWEIMSVALPEFVTVRFSSALEPVATPPKPMLVELTELAGAGDDEAGAVWFEAEPATPTHPIWNNSTLNRQKIATKTKRGWAELDLHRFPRPCAGS